MNAPLTFVVPLAGMLAVAACNARGSDVLVTATSEAMRGAAVSPSPIVHVVFIVQENRSLNNLFVGDPGATTQSYGYDTNGDRIELQAQDLATTWDIDHSSTAFFAACDGRGKLPGTKCKMDGWNDEQAGLHHPANFAYAYAPESEVDPYWKIAKQYVLADHTLTIRQAMPLTFSNSLAGSRRLPAPGPPRIGFCKIGSRDGTTSRRASPATTNAARQRWKTSGTAGLNPAIPLVGLPI